jgi:hypothetical protein
MLLVKLVLSALSSGNRASTEVCHQRLAAKAHRPFRDHRADVPVMAVVPGGGAGRCGRRFFLARGRRRDPRVRKAEWLLRRGWPPGSRYRVLAGTVVRASAAGTIVWTGELPRGRFVTVAHSGGARTSYLDLDSITVARGRHVERGQPLGTLWGRRDSSSSASHLHFDAYMNGTPVDPRLLIDGFNTTSFVRLCPVEEGTEAVATDRRAPAQPPSLSEKVSRPLVSGIKALGSGIGTVWRGVKAAGRARCGATPGVPSREARTG